ncbi:hypothetical protein F6456_42010 [Streptomyces sp. LBUM 1484]|nr:hypothetical protein [Streptomyces sp. LBUM 1484]
MAPGRSPGAPGDRLLHGHQRPGRPGRGPRHVDHRPPRTGRADVGGRGGEDQIPALTVICTYDSLDKIEQTQRTGYAVPPFDLAVMDEAHRIAGRADKKWAIVNDTQRIRADRRLYMTATPRIFAAPELAESADVTRPRRRTTGPNPDVDAFANSMDNEQVYGKKVFEYPLAQAVEDGRRRTTASWCPPSPTRTCAAA